MGGHVDARIGGCGGVCGGHGIGAGIVEGSRVLEFGGAVDLVVCNAVFEEGGELVTCGSGGTGSAVDCLLVGRRGRGMMGDVGPGCGVCVPVPSGCWRLCCRRLGESCERACAETEFGD